MKQNTNNPRRSRGRNNMNRGRNGKLVVLHDGQQVVEGRTRGQLVQALEKYSNLAREAQSSGDRIAAEGFYQHAEHYFRLLSQLNEAQAEQERVAGLAEVEDVMGQDGEDETLPMEEINISSEEESQTLA